MRVPSIAVAVLLLIAVRSAHADDDTDALAPETATGLSLGVTGAGGALVGAAFATDDRVLRRVALIAGGSALMFGPSVGHWYAGELRPTWGGALRGIGLGVGVIALSAYVETCVAQEIIDDKDCALRDQSLTQGLLVVGAMAFAIGAVYDIGTARHAALRENARRASARRRPPGWSVAPIVTPTTRGVSLGTSF